MKRTQYTDERRFPFAALVAAAGGVSTAELARRAGMHLRQMQRYAAAGVPERCADDVAVRLGLHPGEVWPEWFEAAAS